MTTTLDATLRLEERTEARRQAISSLLEGKKRARLGQFFTPAPTAKFIAGQLVLPESGMLRLLDPGAGIGSLTCALVSRVIVQRPSLAVHVTACEVDPGLHAPLRETLKECAAAAAASGVRLTFELRGEDFIGWAAEAAAFGGADLFDAVIMNPPYCKLGSSTRERRLVAAAATDVSNLYAAFLALSIQLLADQGQLVAITPRSFTNGPYFREFRRFFAGRMDLERLHVFQSRTSVFADTDVLQENVIFTARRTDSPRRPPVTISSSHGHQDEPVARTVAYEQVTHPEDPQLFWHIDLDEDADRLAELLAALPATLADLGLTVSTGRVVDFRAADHLHAQPLPGDVPLIYPLHMRDGRIAWPVPNARKSNAIMLNEQTSKLTFPSGYYPVVKRLSSKEERRRVVAALFDPEDVACEAIGFENHVNVFHSGGAGLSSEVARGVTLWLNSSVLDSLVRRFSGHTQVNATDLRNLRYPSKIELAALGSGWGSGPLADQEKIDLLVATHVSACSNILGPHD